MINAPTALGIAKSHFTLGQSLLSPKTLVDLAKKAGYQSVLMADTMTVSGMMEFTTAAKNAEIEPIIGATIVLVDDPFEKTPKKERKTPAYQINVFVKNDTGIKSLYALLSKGNAPERFYYHPRVGFEDLAEALAEGGLISVVCPAASLLFHPKAEERLLQLATAGGENSLYLELSPVHSPYYITHSAAAMAWSRKLRLPVMVARPILYASREEAKTLDVMSAISGKVKITDPWRLEQWVRDFVPFKPEKLLLAVDKMVATLEATAPGSCGTIWEEALAGTERLTKACGYRWQKQPVSLPKMADQELSVLAQMAIDGFKKRLLTPQLGFKPTDLAPYKARLRYELSVLEKMGFERYFLLVRDLIQWAKASGIGVGPGRGSVGGSLIAYLIGITDVDPIRFNLIFERFINPDRIDLPDIDMDFVSTRRHEVTQHLIDQYGADNVAGVSNYTSLVSAGALRDVARTYGIPDTEYSCTKLVPKVHGKSATLEEAAEQVSEIDAFAKKYPEIWEQACAVQGRLRSYGTHAAGVVVAGEPIVNRGALERRGENAVVCWDKRTIEDQGLIKLDILGLSTLDVLSLARQMVKKNSGTDLSYLDISLDDPDTLNAFGEGRTMGVFQFTGGGITHLLKSLRFGGPLTFNDISAATALYRPGPMDSGMMDDYVACRQGVKMPYYAHHALEGATKETYGSLLYQEQLMQISRDLSGFSMAEADTLRSAVSKKNAEKMAKLKDQFVSGATAGYAEVELDDGTIKRVHRNAKFACSDGIKRTVEEAMSAGADITL